MSADQEKLFDVSSLSKPKGQPDDGTTPDGYRKSKPTRSTQHRDKDAIYVKVQPPESLLSKEPVSVVKGD